MNDRKQPPADRYDNVHMKMSEWEQRGGPGRLERWFGRDPLRSAVVLTLGQLVGVGAGMVALALAVDMTWVWTLTAVVLLLGTAGLVPAHLNSARETAKALDAWDRSTTFDGDDPRG